MKKYFEILLNQSIKKAQYIKLNEKLNGIQNLMAMYEFNNNNFYNINNYYNYNNNNYYDNNSDKNNNYNAINNLNIDNNIQDKYNYGKMNKNIYKVNENEEVNKNNELTKTIKKVKNEFKQSFDKYIKELVELYNEKKFQAIKKYFENMSEENQNDNNNKPHTRRDKKVKTIKIKKSNLLSSQFELNQSRNEKTDNEYIKDDNKVEEDSFENNKEKIELRGKNKIENNKINSEKKDNKEFNESEKSNEEKDIFKKDKQIGFSESESQTKALEIFYNKFRQRDAYFSKAQRKYYLMKIIPEDYKINQEKIDNIIDEKILNLNKSTIEDWISEILKLYFQILDKDSIFGNVHIFYSRNMNNFLNIKKLVDDANNYHYQGTGIDGGKSYSDISKVVSQKEKKIFENIDFQIQNNEDTEKNDFSFRYE